MAQDTHNALGYTIICYNYFNIISETNSGQYWVGADDLQDEGQFLWTDGSALASDDPVWVDGEPSGGSEEGCVEILTDPAEPATRLRRLNDFPCSITQDFICQIDL